MNTGCHTQPLCLNLCILCVQSGHNPETYRIFEAVESGSIPVVETQNAKNNCSSPWFPFKASKAPFVFVDDWENIDSFLGVLLKNPSALDRQQEALQGGLC